ncbi:MAG: Coenzyme F420 hydrogenase/dehydrogenase, beta subunit C-terminal domain [Bacteroidaceae bacterium]|nr:Coenzyme F420 hydrogenase/dehydrogenase, beta subunit C-terminal domain [Bacteroidaceae bacterium]
MIQCNDIILAYSNDAEIRQRATSGGIGSTLVNRLFTQGRIRSAISFEYDSEQLKYMPRIVASAEEYAVSGSIYHEINLFAYIREHIEEIKSPFLCFALPCQVNPIKTLLDKEGIEAYIVELTCSSQQTFEATEYLLTRVGVLKSDVSSIRYRGEGWPGGVCITLNDGGTIRIPNNNSVWMSIFHSHLFIMPRCFFCRADRETASDIKLADPWGIDSPALEKLGRTFCHVKSERMASILNGMADEGLISYECRSEKEFLQSQHGTVVRKNYNLRHLWFAKMIKSVLNNKLYRKSVLTSSFLFDAHCFLYTYGCRCLYKIDQILGRK